MRLTKKQIQNFREHIWNYYHNAGRAFVWRNTDNPYYVVVSEVMLQQTQTDRVKTKYEQFIIEFSSFEILASASLRDVLSIWQGLGYNRRGKFLHEIAKKVVSDHDGILPACPDILATFGGLGHATASSICAFAFNIPTVFIETNVRTVFIHTFFSDKDKVSDTEILPLVAATVDQENPREWYYALMDYGVMLKKEFGNANKKSKHYTKQSKFEGSDRQIRGAVVRLLTRHNHLNKEQLLKLLAKEKMRVEKVLAALCDEQLIIHDGKDFTIAGG